MCYFYNRIYLIDLVFFLYIKKNLRVKFSQIDIGEICFLGKQSLIKGIFSGSLERLGKNWNNKYLTPERLTPFLFLLPISFTDYLQILSKSKNTRDTGIFIERWQSVYSITFEINCPCGKGWKVCHNMSYDF